MASNNLPPNNYSPNSVSNNPLLKKEEKNWAMLCHLSVFVVLFNVPCGSILGPLIVWLLKKNDSAFIDEQGREAVNFHITMTLIYVLTFPLLFVLIGFAVYGVVYLLSAICSIIGAIAASNGEHYRYPLTIRFIK